jgi:hypothetical protein
VASTGNERYYADGEAVELAPSDLVCIDTRVGTGIAGVAPEVRRIASAGEEVRSGLVLVRSAELTDDVASALDAGGALHPVFVDPTGGLAVVLPEVRVEATTARQQQVVEEEARSADLPAEVEHKGDSQLVLRPSSGRGADALALANRIYEAAHPAMSQPRLLRVVEPPRPAPS